MYVEKWNESRAPPLNGRRQVHIQVLFRWLRLLKLPDKSLKFSQFVKIITEEFALDLNDIAARTLILFAWAVMKDQIRKTAYGYAWFPTDDEQGLRFYFFQRPGERRESAKKRRNLDPDKMFHARCLRCNFPIPLIGIASDRPMTRGHLTLECGVPVVDLIKQPTLEALVLRAWKAAEEGKNAQKAKKEKTAA